MYEGRVWVPSIGRSSITNGTISYLKMAMWPQNIFVLTSEEEAKDYEKLGVQVVPTSEKGLPACLQYIIDCELKENDDISENEKVIIMDDDLRFAARGPYGPSLHPITQSEMIQMLYWIDEQLNHYVHVGISARQGNNNELGKTKEVASMRSVLAYDLDFIRDNDIRFDRIISKNDYDVTLQLFELHKPNIVSYEYTHDQIGGPTLKGGTTEYRNNEMHQRASKELYNLHPKYVDTVYKEKEAWKNTGGGRWDVRVQWRKAYEESGYGRQG